MKIAILTQSYLPKVGGMQIFAHNMSHQLASQGHHVDVYVPADAYNALSDAYRTMLKPLPWKFFGLLRRFPTLGIRWATYWLRQRQQTERYDVWLAVGTYPAGFAAASLEGIVPLVLRASGEDIQKAPDLGYGVRLDAAVEDRLRRSTQAFDRVVAMTESVQEDFRELGIDAVRIARITNGVDVDWFREGRNQADARSQLGWSTSVPIILTTGRNHRKKGFHLIPAIAQSLNNKGYRFQWHIVGLRTDELDAEINERGLGECVITHGEIGVQDSGSAEWRFPDKSLVRMYQSADIYAFPTLLENFALVQLEAMAAGAAFVGTDAPGCRELVTHGETGLQARAGDVESFAAQLALVLDDSALRAKLAASALEFAESCSWQNVAKKYHSVFAEVIHQRESTDGPLGLIRSTV
jgi:glycosyltransferase involved in cell wall biosynthesis